MKVPARYTLDFAAIQTECPELGSVATSVGPRGYVAWRWSRCGLLLKPNTAGAQSHVAKHVRIALEKQ